MTIVCANARPAFAQAAEYERLVAGYAHGAYERSMIVELAQWPQERLRLAIQSAHIDPEQVKAAAMLHTEAALILNNQRLAYFHLDRARILLGSVPAADRQRLGLTAFTGRWTALEAVVYATYDLRRAQIEIDRALRENVDNRDVLLVAGILNEIELRNAEPNARGHWNSNPTGAIEDRAKAAVNAFIPLVARHPDFLEARLRLGWALFINHSPEVRIREQLDVVAAESPRPDVLYLAHMFLGALEAREGRLEAAAREFESARATLPRQSAYIALIQVNRAIGMTDEAEALAGELAAGRTASLEDPWQVYNAGLTGSEIVEWLRHEAEARP